MHSLIKITGGVSDSAARVRSSVESTSSEAFGTFLDSYVNTQSGSGSLVGLTRQFNENAKALTSFANEVEYAKIETLSTAAMVAIQIAYMAFMAFFTDGASLADFPALVTAGRLVVDKLIGRFVQMVAMMVIPDLVAQGVLLAQHRGWDWRKTGVAFEYGLINGFVAMVAGAGVERLPWMAEGAAYGIVERLANTATHATEGAAVNEITQNVANAINGGPDPGIHLLTDFQAGMLGAIFHGMSLLNGDNYQIDVTGPDGATYHYDVSPKAIKSLVETGALPADLSPNRVLVKRTFNEKGWIVREPKFDFSGTGASGAPIEAITARFGGASVRFARRSGGTAGQAGRKGTWDVVSRTEPILARRGVRVAYRNGESEVLPRGSRVSAAGDLKSADAYRAEVPDGRGGTVVLQTAIPGDPLYPTGRIDARGNHYALEPSAPAGGAGGAGQTGVAAGLSPDPLTYRSQRVSPGSAEYERAFGDRWSHTADPQVSGLVDAARQAVTGTAAGPGVARDAVARDVASARTAAEGQAANYNSQAAAARDTVVRETDSRAAALRQADEQGQIAKAKRIEAAQAGESQARAQAEADRLAPAKRAAENVASQAADRSAAWSRVAGPSALADQQRALALADQQRALGRAAEAEQGRSLAQAEAARLGAAKQAAEDAARTADTARADAQQAADSHGRAAQAASQAAGAHADEASKAERLVGRYQNIAESLDAARRRAAATATDPLLRAADQAVVHAVGARTAEGEAQVAAAKAARYAAGLDTAESRARSHRAAEVRALREAGQLAARTAPGSSPDPREGALRVQAANEAALAQEAETRAGRWKKLLDNAETTATAQTIESVAGHLTALEIANGGNVANAGAAGSSGRPVLVSTGPRGAPGPDLLGDTAESKTILRLPPFQTMSKRVPRVGKYGLSLTEDRSPWLPKWHQRDTVKIVAELRKAITGKPSQDAVSAAIEDAVRKTTELPSYAQLDRRLQHLAIQRILQVAGDVPRDVPMSSTAERRLWYLARRRQPKAPNEYEQLNSWFTSITAKSARKFEIRLVTLADGTKHLAASMKITERTLSEASNMLYRPKASGDFSVGGVRLSGTYAGYSGDAASLRQRVKEESVWAVRISGANGPRFYRGRAADFAGEPAKMQVGNRFNPYLGVSLSPDALHPFGYAGHVLSSLHLTGMAGALSGIPVVGVVGAILHGWGPEVAISTDPIVSGHYNQLSSRATLTYKVENITAPTGLYLELSSPGILDRLAWLRIPFWGGHFDSNTALALYLRFDPLTPLRRPGPDGKMVTPDWLNLPVAYGMQFLAPRLNIGRGISRWNIGQLLGENWYNTLPDHARNQSP